MISIVIYLLKKLCKFLNRHAANIRQLFGIQLFGNLFHFSEFGRILRTVRPNIEANHVNKHNSQRIILPTNVFM